MTDRKKTEEERWSWRETDNALSVGTWGREWGRPQSLQDVVVTAALAVCRRDWASEPPAPVHLGRKAKMQVVLETYTS